MSEPMSEPMSEDTTPYRFTPTPKKEHEFTPAMRAAYQKMSLKWQTAKEINAPEEELFGVVDQSLAECKIGGNQSYDTFRFRLIRESDEPEEASDWKPDYDLTPRWIVCAAMRQNGRIITGARHFDKIMRQQMRTTEGLKWWRSSEQGFIDQFGDFLTREEAWDIALENGQIHREVSSPGKLFSENLY